MYDEKRWRSELNTAYAKGFKEGFKEGFEEGLAEVRAEMKLKTAKKCKEYGYPINVIVEVTGLPEEVIANL